MGLAEINEMLRERFERDHDFRERILEPTRRKSVVLESLKSPQRPRIDVAPHTREIPDP